MLALAVLVQRLPTIAWSDCDRSARHAAWLITATLALCLIQILPLPRSIWMGLPGHEVAAQIGAAVGEDGWTAWSLAPDRTLDILMAIVPFAAGLVIAAQASPDQRRAILRTVLVVALVSAVLAVIQVGLGPGAAPMLFDSRHRGLGVGLFVNRNHFALFLLLAMLVVALPGVPTPRRKVENPEAVEWGMRAGALVLLSLGVLATLSRAGIFLLPVGLAAAFLLNRRRRVKPAVLVGGMAVAGLFAFALRWAPPVQSMLERFATAAEDKRFQYWDNTLAALRDALPLGTGLGTFTLVYPTYEPLNEVHPDVVNHAHNDFLELVMEAGLPGAVLLLAWLAFITMAVIRARRAAQVRRERLLPLVVATAVGLALAASLVDYPVRMNAIAVTLALMVGMLIPLNATSHLPSQVAAPVRSNGRWLWAVPAVLLGVLATSSQWAQQLVLAKRPQLATMIAPWSSQAQAALATRYQMFGEAAASSRAARRALAVSPLDPAALRAQGMAALALGRSEQGAKLMSLGARLGWRDAITQLWLIEQALAAGAHGFATQRIDALLRQEKAGEVLLPLMPELLRSPDGRAALAEQLSFEPGWRVAFFNDVARSRNWTMPQMLDLAARLRQAGSPITGADTALIRAVLANGGRFADARRIWRETGQVALLGDGDFEAAPGELPRWAAPYVWYAPELTGVRVETAQAQIAREGQALAITSEGLTSGGALKQTIVLAPGPYRLTLSAASQEGTVLPQLSAVLRCRHDEADADPSITIPLTWRGGKDDWQDAAGTFVVPPDCPGQSLIVSIPQTGARPYSLWLDSVSIRTTHPPHA